MTIESLSTALLALTGPVTALMLAGFLLTRRTDGSWNLWFAVWLIGLAMRFGKSTLHALFGLEPWALNIGLSGMLAAPTALYLASRASARAQRALQRKDLLHFAPSLILATASPLIPNERGDTASALIYVCVLAAWAAYLLAAWRWFSAPTAKEHAARTLLRVALFATSLMGVLFALVFGWTPQLYLLNGVVFSLTTVALAGLTLADTRSLKGQKSKLQPPDQEHRALVERVREALSDPTLLGDTNTNLARVARRLGVPAKALSTAINRVTGDSFTTLLNSVRLAEAQRLMRDSQESLEAIAASCGFSSASAFHRTFRRHLRTTPAAWRVATRETSRAHG